MSLTLRAVLSAAVIAGLAAAGAVKYYQDKKAKEEALRLIPEKTETVGLANPVRQAGSIGELSEALGVPFPVVPEKEAKTCLITSASGKLFRCEARYTDGSSLAIGPMTNDISGIWGGKFTETLLAGDTQAELFVYEDRAYALFSHGEFSCCYYAPVGEKDPAKILFALETVLNAFQF